MVEFKCITMEALIMRFLGDGDVVFNEVGNDRNFRS